VNSYLRVGRHIVGKLAGDTFKLYLNTKYQIE